MSSFLLNIKDLFELKLKSFIERPLEAGDFRSKKLDEAINYGLAFGKRLRPLLVLSMAFDLDKNRALSAMPAALAVELVHNYSLIHDDLPSMDNDDFRRGRLSMHRRFDEATAILTGDALLADAFFLTAYSKINPHKLTLELAKASGTRALVAGQVEDLSKNQNKNWDLINRAKTARLFKASAIMGALAVGLEVSRAETIGHHFGMAYQIKDDLEDKQGLALEKNHDELLYLKKFHIDSMKALAGPHTLLLIDNSFGC
jgi:geranylgeranyl diphosphate synthase type II